MRLPPRFHPLHRFAWLRWRAGLLLASLLLAGATLLYAQLPGGGRAGRGGGGMGGGFGGGFGGGRGRAPAANRADYPMWENAKGFESDVFTFARIQFESFGGRGGRGSSWSNDFPDSDWNFSFRLQQLTTIATDPMGKVFRLTDPELFDYPFIFMTNVQDMALDPQEAAALRKYLLGGGFLMADDFWTPAAWRHVQRVMQQVFPDRQPRELPLEHEIFHIVYDLKSLPQVPSILAWQQGDRFEYWHGDPEGDEAPHFHGYFDDAGRLVALFCQNNDIGDGWEREGESKEYFQEFSEKWSYPFGINVITYAMTH